MPIYEFECPNGTITERFVSLDTDEIMCPICENQAKKIMSDCNFQLKGGGWAKDGYAHNGNHIQSSK